MRDSYAILGLGRARSPWFGAVAAWTTSGAVPASLTKCVSPAELRQRLSSLQPWSALMIDADFISLDPDLLRVAAARGVPTLVVTSNAAIKQSMAALSPTAVLDAEMNPGTLLAALGAHGQLLAKTSQEELHAAVEEATAWSGCFIAVCGPGGTGTSTVAIAIAQGLSAHEVDNGLVALVDFTRNSEQAMLHDAPDELPTVEDLIEMHRSRRPGGDEVRSLLTAVSARGYGLLPGMRKASAWTAMPQRAVNASIEGLRRSVRYVVADITADFEGETASGSSDVEERNALARAAATEASLVVVTGAAGMKGIHALGRTIRDLIELGVPTDRILPVVNRAPKSHSARSEMAKALAVLTHHRGVQVALPSPLFLPERDLEPALRDTAPLPKQVVGPVRAAVAAVLERTVEPRSETEEPTAIVPGSLGFLDEAAG